MNDDILKAMQYEFVYDLNPVNTTGAAPYRMTYQFATSFAPSDLPTSTGYTGWTAFTGAEQAKIRALLDHVESIVNIQFVEVTGQSDPDLNLGKVDFSGTTSGRGGPAITFIGDTIQSWDGYAVFKNTLDLSAPAEEDLILHEIAHALGLSHPFDSDKLTLPSNLENNKYTVMSYTPNPDNGQDSDALQILDILALQDIWGAARANAGDTVYTGSRVDTVDAIWDSGGTDRFDAGGYRTDVTLDLRAGNFSTFGRYPDVAIAYGVKIEDATGGAGNDRLIGNGSANTLLGGSGNDRISGGQGRDVLDGGTGRDALSGDGGGDRLLGRGGADKLVGKGGNDDLDGGGGRDRLIGGKGDDSLAGNAGVDRFIYARGHGADVIEDFREDVDKLIFKGLGDAAVVLRSASETGGDVVFDFGGGNTLTVLDTTIAAITDDIL